MNRSTFCLVVASAVASLWGQARAAQVTLAVTDAAGQSSFTTDSLSHWNPAGDPVAGNSYLVPGGLALRTPFDTAANTFAGDSLTLGNNGASNGILILKNLTAATVNIGFLTLDKGEIQNGGTAAGAATVVTLTGSELNITANGATINTGGATRGLIFAAPVFSDGNIAVTGGGLVRFTNSFSSTGNLNLGGTLGIAADFTASLGVNAGQTQLTGTSGWAAFGADRTVNVGGAGAALTWGDTGFAPSTLVLGHAASDATTHFVNPLDIGGANRTVLVDNGSADIDATITGAVTGGNRLTKSGGGTLVLSNAGNTFSGGLDIGTNATGARVGVVRATASGAAGTGTILIGNGGNDATARLELAGGVTLDNPINLPGRNNTTVAIQSMSGSNTLTNRIDANSGGSAYIVQVDAGSTLALIGSTDAGGVVFSSLAGARILTVQGDGNASIGGIVQNGAGTVALTKAGPGTLTLAGANTYTGATTVNSGVLSISASDRLPDASNLALGGGTLRTNGFSDVLALLSVTASSSIDLGSGASVLRFADSSAQAWTGTLSIENWTAGLDHLFVGTSAAGLTSGQLSQVQFLGAPTGAMLLSTGELVPVPEPTTLAGLVLGGMGVASRRRTKR